MAVVMEEVKKQCFPPKYKAVASVLREGKENAITSDSIMKVCEIDSKREVMEIVERLIVDHGYCIGTGRNKNKGYYLISDQKELETTLRTYSKQIQSMMNRRQRLAENFNESLKLM